MSIISSLKLVTYIRELSFLILICLYTLLKFDYTKNNQSINQLKEVT